MNADQIDHLNAFGFVVLKSLFRSDEMKIIEAAAQEIWNEDARDHERLEERQQVNGIVERSAFLTSLLCDDRIYESVRVILGNDLIWIGSDGSRYFENTGWHSDGSNFDCRRIKALFYLDRLTRDTGSLRVFPGSHKGDFHRVLTSLLQRSDLRMTPYGVRAPFREHSNLRVFGMSPFDLPAWAVETNPGDVVFFDQNIWHSSYGGKPGRALISMTFGESPRTEQALAFVGQMYAGQLEHVRTRQWSPRTELFGEQFLRDQRPRLKRMLSAIDKLHAR